MNMQDFSAEQLPGIIRDLEEAVENANLLALELALKSFEDDESGEAAEDVCKLVNSAATATEELERLVRRLKAA